MRTKRLISISIALVLCFCLGLGTFSYAGSHYGSNLQINVSDNSASTRVFAQSVANQENCHVNNILEAENIITVRKSSNPLNDFFNDIIRSDNAKLEIYSNTKEMDVTNVWNDYLRNLFIKNKLSEIQSLVEKYNLQLSSTCISSNVVEPKGSVQTETITKNFYHQGTANNTTLSWVMSLSGTIRYSTVSKKILSATAPSVSLISIEFDYPWRPYITNVSSNYTIHASSVTFEGKYTMMAIYGYAMTGGTYNFGTKRMLFEGYPAF